VVEPTCIEAQEIENTGEGVRIECGFFEIVPSEEGAGPSRSVEPWSESLEVGLLSKCQPSLTRNPYQVRDCKHEEFDEGNNPHCPFEPKETRYSCSLHARCTHIPNELNQVAGRNRDDCSTQ